VTRSVTLQTPLEACRHTRITQSAEIADFLALLAAHSDEAECVTLGYAVSGAPLRALLCRRDSRSLKPRVMLVGSHHGGSEPAGGEALLEVARALLHGDLAALLDHLDIAILPNANPDGRDADSSRNANSVNLNRDYVLLSQPESRALNSAVQRYRPDVVLDAHESAALKRKSLGRAGYLTEFQAQFDVANNPALPAAQLSFGEDVLLNELIRRVSHTGLHAQRYIREILSLEQALTYGGITIKRFRNKAAALGALSFLLETRLDPKAGEYPSFRNIEVRTAKQVRCIRIFLTLMAERAAELLALRRAPRGLQPGDPMVLSAEYAPRAEGAMMTVPLRRIDTGEVVDMVFRDHRRMALHPPIAAPRAYLVARHAGVVRDLLWRHGLHFHYLPRAESVRVVEQRVEQVFADGELALRTSERERSVQMPAGALRIPLDQPCGRVVPLLFEPGSSSMAYGYPAYRRLLCPGEPLFVYREL